MMTDQLHSPLDNAHVPALDGDIAAANGLSLPATDEQRFDLDAGLASAEVAAGDDVVTAPPAPTGAVEPTPTVDEATCDLLDEDTAATGVGLLADKPGHKTDIAATPEGAEVTEGGAETEPAMQAATGELGVSDIDLTGPCSDDAMTTRADAEKEVGVDRPADADGDLTSVQLQTDSPGCAAHGAAEDRSPVEAAVETATRVQRHVEGPQGADGADIAGSSHEQHDVDGDAAALSDTSSGGIDGRSVATGGGFDVDVLMQPIKVGMYGCNEYGLFMDQAKAGGQTDRVRLTNFSCRIISDMTIDDGSGAHYRVFRLAAQVHGGKPVEFDVLADQFDNLRGWVPNKLGATAIVYGQSMFNATIAIREVSKIAGVIERVTAAHVGWGKHHSDAVFITGDTVLAAAGVDISSLRLNLPNDAKGFALPAIPEGAPRDAAVRALAEVLKMGDLGALHGILPLWLFALRPALPVDPPPYLVWVHGKSGTFKSATAGVLQSLYGPTWSGEKLPGSFLSTMTASERLMYVGKNMLIVLDDAQADDRRSRDEVDRITTRIARGVGNRTSRERVTSDLRQRPAWTPRSAVLITAEKLPPGFSASARMLQVHVQPGDIDLHWLTQCQSHGRSGLLAAALSAFIGSILAQGTDTAARLFQDRVTYHLPRVNRLLVARGGAHARTPSIIADLLATADIAMAFFRNEAVALPFDDAAAEDVLITAGAAQGKSLSQINPVQMFRDGFEQLVASGTVRIADRVTGGKPRNVDARPWGWPDITVDDRRSGQVIGGYADIEEAVAKRSRVTRLYLVFDEVWSRIVEAARRAGEEIPLNARSIIRALADDKLVRAGADQLKTTVRVAGQVKRVLDCDVRIMAADDATALTVSKPIPPPAEPEGLF